jgi:hypothetical protein
MATCTAPDHPDCTIDCDNGCWAVYWEPDGPCDTGCSDRVKKLAIRKDARISVSLKDVSFSVLAQLFSDLLKINPSDRKLSLIMKKASLPELMERLKRETC